MKSNHEMYQEIIEVGEQGANILGELWKYESDIDTGKLLEARNALSNFTNIIENYLIDMRMKEAYNYEPNKASVA